MLEILVVALVWAFVTVIGHASWLVGATILNSVFGRQEPEQSGPNLADDLAATHRVLSLMAAERLLEADEIRARRSEIDGLNEQVWRARRRAQRERDQPTSAKQTVTDRKQEPKRHEPAQQATSPPLSEPENERPESIGTRPVSSDTVFSELVSSDPLPFNENPVAAATESEETRDETSAPLVRPFHVSQPSNPQPQRSAPPESQAPHEPSVSWGESMAAFLADHNIRWGELIAGALIVVCSIGLVISLWSTLTETHRVIPSLIFLSGNTAIFGAGLYTLFRWRLPDTSRATLLIAMLLVPLGILAGLSTGGIGTTAVLLSDPITIAAIALASGIYSWLLWHASRALVGSKNAIAMTMGVAGPAAVLPFVPAAIRSWDASAGAFVLVASVAIWVSQTRLQSSVGRTSRRAMTIAVSMFSLSVLLGYFAFLTRELDASWMMLAIASMPGLIAFSASASARSAEVATRRPKLALLGTVFAWCIAMACGVLLIPALVSMPWLFAWGVVYSVSAALAAFVFRNHRWTLLSVFPIGIATVLSSPSFFSVVPWDQIPVWRRLIGGEPMLSAIAIGAATFALVKVMGKVDRQRSSGLRFAALGWLGYGVVNAAILTVAPAHWMGAVPVGLLPLALGAAAISVVIESMRSQQDRGNELQASSVFAGLAGAVTLAFWVSVFKPIVIGLPFAELKSFALTFFATGLCLLLFSEVALKRALFATRYRQCAVLFLTVAGLFAAVLPESLAVLTSVVLLVTMLALWWIAVRGQNALAMGLSRAFLILSALVIGHRCFGQTLTEVDAWRDGTAWWGWSAVALIVTAFSGIQDRLTIRFPTGVYLEASSASQESAEERDHLLGYTISLFFAAVANILGAIGSVIAFGSLVAAVLLEREPGSTSLGISTDIALPAFVLSGLAALAFVGHRLVVVSRKEEAFRLRSQGAAALTVVIVSALLWLGWQLGLRWFVEVESQLVVATSFSAIGCFVMEFLGRGVQGDPSERLDQTQAIGLPASLKKEGVLAIAGLTVVAVSSLALMVGGWIPAIADARSPQWFSTVSIAAWWLVGAITSLWVGYRERSRVHCGIFASLIPAVVLLVSPLFYGNQFWVWAQLAALSSFFVALLGRLFLSRGRRNAMLDERLNDALQPALNASLGFGVLIGLSTCMGTIVGILLGQSQWMRLHNHAGILVSLLSVVTLLFYHRLGEINSTQKVNQPERLGWPIAISLLSGHLTLGLINQVPAANDSHWLLSLIWIFAVAVSFIEYVRLAFRNETSDRFNLRHAVTLVIGVAILAVIFGDSRSDFRVGFAAAAIGVLMTTARAVVAAWEVSPPQESLRRSVTLNKLMGLFSVSMGATAIVRLGLYNDPFFSDWTVLLGWIGGVALLWRIVAPDSHVENTYVNHVPQRLTDGLLAVGVLTALAVEAGLLWMNPSEVVTRGLFQDPLFWCRIAIGLLLSVSAVFRVRRSGMLEVGLLTGMLTITIVAMRFALFQQGTAMNSAMNSAMNNAMDSVMSSAINTAVAACIAAAIGFAVLVFRAGNLSTFTSVSNRYWHGLLPYSEPRLSGELNSTAGLFTRSLVRVGAVPVAVCLAVCVWLLLVANGLALVPVAICSIALLAIAVGELGEQTNRVPLRDVAMTLGLITIAMWASVDVIDSVFPLLALSTRWFVAWVIVAVSLTLAVPKLLSQIARERWQQPVRRGVFLAIVLAVGSLVATLGQEAVVRTSGQTELLDHALVLGMAVVLGVMSLVTTFASVVSGPGFSYREVWKLTDRQRSMLVISAQVLGGLTWFHLFLCKNPLASLGLRAYWPYVVMALAFASTGITHWARRRGDDVLQQTLKQTALFLPLIPVIGFWLSGSLVTSFFGDAEGKAWTFIQGRVSYQALLIAVAVYYGVISFLWKSGRTRVASIVFGNIALWVILLQTPGWSFLTHPQAWLIPPALCALAATHLYRKALGDTSVKGIRYAATLVIYVTSTADMLVQGLGETLMGPIVLIVLALLGMTAGIALRVRPFLYLGATFVMLGLLSMVYHAQQQIDAVWPWWVFGITTGVLLLGGLMGIEKKKPQLKLIAQSMSRWDS